MQILRLNTKILNEDLTPAYQSPEFVIPLALSSSVFHFHWALPTTDVPQVMLCFLQCCPYATPIASLPLYILFLSQSAWNI